MDKFMNSESSSEDGLSTGNVHHPAFFQLYIPEHNSMKLRIPPPFIKNFGGNIPEKILLKNSSGRVSRAKLTYIDNELHITHGWKQYVNDHQIQRGDFVVFRYQLDSTFLVMVFGPDSMVKDEPGTKKASTKSKGDVRETRQTEVGKLIFYKTFKNKFKNFVGVPEYIVEACSMTLPQSVELYHENGMSVTTHLRQTKQRVILGYLSKFMRMNMVQDGDKLEFEIICEHGNKIKHIIMRNKTRSNVLRRGY